MAWAKTVYVNLGELSPPLSEGIDFRIPVIGLFNARVYVRVTVNA